MITWSHAQYSDRYVSSWLFEFPRQQAKLLSLSGREIVQQDYKYFNGNEESRQQFKIKLAASIITLKYHFVANRSCLIIFRF